jgi:hypothetical protein
MREIFFTALPQVGREYTIEELNLNSDGRKKLATVTINRVDERTEQEWNPVLKTRVPVLRHYILFTTTEGLSYERRAVVTSLTEGVLAPNPAGSS